MRHALNILSHSFVALCAYPFNRAVFLKRLRLLIEELGPVYVKIMQCLSTRSDAFSEDFLREMAKLRSNVTPESAQVMQAQLQAGVSGSANDIFANFDWTPIGCGSVAQVYRAELRSGQTVAVKLLRPNIERRIRQNFALIGRLARWLEALSRSLRAVRIANIVGEIQELLLAQTDLGCELNNNRKFKAMLAEKSFNFLGKEMIVVPEVYPEHSSKNLLVMEYIDGIDPYSFDVLGIERSTLVRAVDNLLDTMIFFNGLMHADLHPGNFFWNRAGQIVLVDFGLVFELDKAQREHVRTAFSSIVDGYIEFSAAYILEHFAVSFDNDPLDPATHDKAAKELGQIITSHFVTSRGKPRFGVLFGEIITCLSTLKLGLTSKFSKIFLTLVTIDGYMYHLDPAFDMLENMRRKLLEIVEYNAVPVSIEKLMLGQHGTYSTACFEHTDDPQQAYAAMQARVLGSLDVPADSYVLDVGCGRGKLLEKIQQRGLKCFGITLSQFEQQVCVANGLECVHCSWETYDAHAELRRKVGAIVVVEMLVHLSSLHDNRVGLGALRLDRFFDWASKTLADDGSMYMQELIIDDALLDEPSAREMYDKVNQRLPFVGFSTLRNIRAGASRYFDILSMVDDSRDLVPTYRFWKAGVVRHERQVRSGVNASVFEFLSSGVDMLLELSEKKLLKLYRIELRKKPRGASLGRSGVIRREDRLAS
jgi:ubiquinone biosynthesis protein